MQRTRLDEQVLSSGGSLIRWAGNPWRRVSLLAITLLVAFFFGNAISAIAGALALLDPMAAFACVLFGELLIRQRPRLLRQADRLWLGLIDMLRIGFLSGLILDGFRFSS